MKKTIAILVIVAILLAALSSVAFAHGHGGRYGASNTVTLCKVKNCNTTSIHKHSGVTYGGHYIGDGHSYHTACSIASCTATGKHTHNGVTCLPCTNTDVCSYHSAKHSSQ